MKIVFSPSEENGLKEIFVALEESYPDLETGASGLHERRSETLNAVQCVFHDEGGVTLSYNEELVVDIMDFYVRWIPRTVPVVEALVSMSKAIKSIVNSIKSLIPSLEAMGEEMKEDFVAMAKKYE